MRTTRKKKHGVIRTTRNQAFNRELPTLHRKLSRIDVEKDAVRVNSDIVIQADKKPYFTRIANEMFGPLDIYEKSRFELEMEIDVLVGSIVQYHKCKVYTAFLDKGSGSLIPEHIVYAVQDSGVAPSVLKNTIEYLITPGSYLDPCGRSWSNTVKLFGFNTSFTVEDFKSLQLPVSEVRTKFNPLTQECTAFISLHGNTIVAQFNKEFRPVNKDAEFYFDGGNTTKNKWFNNPYAFGSLGMDEIARNLIVCKEMGDMLQAYYGKLFMNSLSETKQKSVCVFTCDKVLVRRCQLLKVPIVYTSAYRENDKKAISVYEVPKMIYANMDMVHYYKKYIANNNKSVTESIVKIIDQGWYNSRSGERIAVSTQLRNELLNVCKLIEERTNAALFMNYDTMTLEDYRLFVNYYKPVTLINFHQNTFYTFPDYLFVHKFKTDQPILATVRRLITTGGAHEEKYVYDTTQKYGDFKNLGERMPDVENLFEHATSNIVIQYDIFNSLKGIFPEKSDDELCFLTNDVYSAMHYYYTYTGEMWYYDAYILAILDILKRPEWPDYEEFLEIHNSLAQTYSERMDYIDVRHYADQLEAILAVLRQYRESMNSVRNYWGAQNLTRKRGVKARGTRKRGVKARGTRKRGIFSGSDWLHA